MVKSLTHINPETNAPYSSRQKKKKNGWCKLCQSTISIKHRVLYITQQLPLCTYILIQAILLTPITSRDKIQLVEE